MSKGIVSRMRIIVNLFIILAIAVTFAMTSHPAPRSIAPDQVIQPVRVEMRAIFVNGELEVWEVA